MSFISTLQSSLPDTIAIITGGFIGWICTYIWHKYSANSPEIQVTVLNAIEENTRKAIRVINIQLPKTNSKYSVSKFKSNADLYHLEHDRKVHSDQWVLGFDDAYTLREKIESNSFSSNRTYSKNVEHVDDTKSLLIGSYSSEEITLHFRISLSSFPFIAHKRVTI